MFLLFLSNKSPTLLRMIRATHWAHLYSASLGSLSYYPTSCLNHLFLYTVICSYILYSLRVCRYRGKHSLAPISAWNCLGFVSHSGPSRFARVIHILGIHDGRRVDARTIWVRLIVRGELDALRLSTIDEKHDVADDIAILKFFLTDNCLLDRFQLSSGQTLSITSRNPAVFHFVSTFEETHNLEQFHTRAIAKAFDCD